MPRLPGMLKSMKSLLQRADASNTDAANETNSLTGVEIGEVLDSTKTPVLDSNNQIKDSAKSYWSSQADGRQVT